MKHTHTHIKEELLGRFSRKSTSENATSFCKDKTHNLVIVIMHPRRHIDTESEGLGKREKLSKA